MEKAVIVHLSDIHYNGSEESCKIIDNLLKDLDTMKSEVGHYDLLAITGDCIDKGKTQLFEEFSKKVNLILKTCELPIKNKTIVVPGNHDASYNNQWIRNLVSTHGQKYEMINQNIENDLTIFYKEFNEFVQKYSSPINGVGIKYLTVNGIVIRSIFINSSWSTLSHDLSENVYGKLCIGDMQLDEISKKLSIRKKKYDITIACMHHSLDWFEYNERIKLQNFLYSTVKVDFIFHGHIHDASYDSIFNMDSSTNIFCTGIAYNKTGENCSRKDGYRYSIYELDKYTRTINVYLRSTNNKGEFVSDNRLYSKVNKEGFFTVPMGNITECIIPIKSVDNNKKYNLFLNKEIVELILKKEEKLFKYYCGMDATLEQMLQKSKKDNFFENWKKLNNKKILNRNDKILCEKDFYKEQFELYCMYALNNLNALFFSNHTDIRFLLRRYDPIQNKHIVVFAEGTRSTIEDIKRVKNFTWGEGMIYHSYKAKSPLLKSTNLKCHKDGNTRDIWKEYLTIAIDGIEVHKSRELIPLLALNIATESADNEKCLHALAMSSIYDKMQEIFKLFNYKAYDLLKLYDI